MAEGMPGTSWKGTPWRASSSSSSPPRPKRKGSPPFKRTTRLPCKALSSRSWLISSWGMVWREASLPTSMRSAPGGIRSRISRPTSRS